MTVKANDLPTNNLYINEIEQNTSSNSLELGSDEECKSTPSPYGNEIKVSDTLIKIIWRIIDAAFVGSIEENSFSFSDKLLIEDVMHFGTLTKVAEKRGAPYFSVQQQFKQAMIRLSNRLRALEASASQMKKAQMQTEKKSENEIGLQAAYAEQGKQLKALKAQLAKANDENARLTHQRDVAVEKNRALLLEKAQRHQRPFRK